MKILTLKNRTDKPFTGMYDGVEYVIPADGQLVVLDFIAYHLKKQSVCRYNPVMGDADFRLAILELGDDDSPLTTIPIETFDRTDMDLHKTQIVKVGNRTAVPVHKANTGSVFTAKERGA